MHSILNDNIKSIRLSSLYTVIVEDLTITVCGWGFLVCVFRVMGFIFIVLVCVVSYDLIGLVIAAPHRSLKN